jgi:hypothetical protein
VCNESQSQVTIQQFVKSYFLLITNAPSLKQCFILLTKKITKKETQLNSHDDLQWENKEEKEKKFSSLALHEFFC